MSRIEVFRSCIISGVASEISILTISAKLKQDNGNFDFTINSEFIFQIGDSVAVVAGESVGFIGKINEISQEVSGDIVLRVRKNG